MRDATDVSLACPNGKINREETFFDRREERPDIEWNALAEMDAKTWSQSRPRRFLGEWEGILQTDGYQAYDGIGGPKLVHESAVL